MTNITNIELNSLKQQLDYELKIIGKYKKYSKECKDPQLKQKFEEMASNHEEHYVRLLNQL